MRFPIVGTFFWLAAALCATAQTFYAITDLGPGRAYAINELGHVAGETELRNGDHHAFRWTPDGLTDLGTLGGPSSRAFGLNASNLVVGEAETADGSTVACIWRNDEPAGIATGGTVYAVNDSGAMAGVVNEAAALWTSPESAPQSITARGAIGIAFDLDPAGRVVGQAEAAEAEDRVSRAFLFQNGVTAALADLGRGLSSSAQAINRNGAIAGFFEPARGQTHAFLFDTNGLRDLDTLNNAYSAAYGMNNKGAVVGVMFNSPSDDDVAFLWSDGSMYNLNDLLDTRENWNLVEAWGINDAGQIVGYGIKNGTERALLLTPLENAVGRLPRVRLTSDSGSATLIEPATILLTATAESSTPLRRVSFYANGEIIGTASTPPYALTWSNARAGDYDLVARAFDTRGPMGVSPRVRLAVELATRAPAPSAVPPPTPTPPPSPNVAPSPATDNETPEEFRPAGADAP